MRRPLPTSALISVNDKYSRKRQRRQAAAVVVQSLWSNSPTANASPAGRKSTAQPRPDILIPPRGIGPIVDPNQHDVLCGRGGRINSHSGNIQFREMVQERKKLYLAKTTKKLEKAHIAARIVREIREMDPPGRFLKEDRGTGLWFDIGDQKAIKKSGQALREDAPDLRVEIDDDSSGDDKAKAGSTPSMKAGAATANPTKKVPKTPPAPPKTPSHSQLKQPPPPTQNHATPVAQSADQGPQHIPSAVNPFPEVPRGMAQLSAEEYAAKVAMPPPFSQAQQQSSQNIRTIPIQAPPSQHTYSMPMYSGANMSGGRSVSKNSRHAMQTLAEDQASSQQQPPPDVAFNKAFFPAPSALSGGHTMSSMSGISDSISSMVPGSGYGANQSQMQSKFPNNDTVRISQLQRLRNSEAAQSNRSDMTFGSMRSMGSLTLTRSTSFPDSATFADQDSYKAIMDGDDDFASGIMSVSSNKYSVYSAGPEGNFEQNAGWSHPAAARSRNASTHSARSLSMMSVGTITSAQYASRRGGGGGGSSLIGGGSSLIGMDDVRSNVSDMSSDFHALDLAGTFR